MKADEIRKLVTANHGGMNTASNSQLRILWNSLSDETRKRYIKESKAENNADSK